ncbi:MAG TPA: ATP-dependent DNA helicase, partial [Clostridia bacterium]
MSNYEQNLQEETEYLEKTLSFISNELHRQNNLLSDRKASLRSSSKDMWENSVHFSNDFDKLTEVNQYLSEVTMHTASYKSTETQIAKYKRVLGSPYFGRFDFVEEGFNGEEKIYIGLHNIMDPKTHEIYVYDWRAPISSIFYQYELGKAFYKAPSGDISGDVLLKRQYKIEDSSLKYFFDCNIVIGDEILQKVLSRNASPKMKNIVETIQREQDIIIRDTENELLIVQGVAG